MNYPELTDFTPREYDVLQLCAKGYTNKKIADELGVTIHAVKVHICNIYKKFNSPYRERVAITAIQLGLVNPNKFLSLQDALIEKGYIEVDNN